MLLRLRAGRYHDRSHQVNTCSYWVTGALILCLIIFTGCSRSVDDHNHPELKTGKQLFNHHCSSCHGDDGTGRLADQTPANILTFRGRDGIVEYITTTVRGDRAMPVFKQMPRAEAVLIASHLLQLRKRYERISPANKKPEELMIRP